MVVVLMKLNAPKGLRSLKGTAMPMCSPCKYSPGAFCGGANLLIKRDVVRAVVLNVSDRVLLFHTRDLGSPAFGILWNFRRFCRASSQVRRLKSPLSFGLNGVNS
jgi:hypothetical protein